MFVLGAIFSGEQASRPRARDVGIDIGIFAPGEFNAITDVAGVLVGQKTIIRGKNIRTGVTAILPHSGNLFKEKVQGAIFCGNGFGKLMGYTQVKELGTIETPILLTNTLSVPQVADAVIEYMLSLDGNENVRSINPVVGETNDGYLNDIRARAVTKYDVFDAIKRAKSGPVEEGSVGAGTGTMCLGWKGGIGTSSRVLPKEMGGYTVGVLVQTNFGGTLSVNGAPVGRELGNFMYAKEQEGSCMIVVATDAPLTAKDLERLASRALYGLARAGGFGSNGSGDYVIAFSTANRIEDSPASSTREEKVMNSDYLSPLFCAVVEATEEAIINSLLKATIVKGFKGAVEAIPVDKVVEICEEHKALNWGSIY
ncbi:MAG: P1 family peptidase [Candidatus Thermoplasmatota archaeon]|nr:P1 family peptidase [Candidatus Thermoplasmatota archaeon]